MNYFQRREQKYMMSRKQAERFLAVLHEELSEDAYSPYSIASLYFDTGQEDLMLHCMDKPACRCKVRLRSYGQASEESPVFFEIKEKVKGVTYKKREALTWSAVRPHLDSLDRISFQTPDFRRLCRRYDLHPFCFISYSRKAWYWKNDPEIRITFDTDLKIRYDNLALDHTGGQSVLDEDQVLVEIKAALGIPYKVARALSELKIMPFSFSKAGTAFLGRPAAEILEGIPSA